MMRRCVLALWGVGAACSAIAAQNVETDPMQCWWRTSAGAIRVGEPFSLVLTCAVVENDAAKVVVDQSKLEPSVIQLAPFEVTGGSHRADPRTHERRFFSFRVCPRLVCEKPFGRGRPVPGAKRFVPLPTPTTQPT